MTWRSAAEIPDLCDQPKRCPLCNRDLVGADFYIDRRRPDWLSVWCRSCIGAWAGLRQSDRAAAQAKPRKRRRSEGTDWGALPGIPAALERLELLEQGRKRCTSCRKILDLDAFSPSPGRPSGRDAYCRVCRRNRATAVRAYRRRVQQLAEQQSASEPTQRCPKCHRELPASHFVSLRTSEPANRCVRCQKWNVDPSALTPVQAAFIAWGEPAAEAAREQQDQVIAEQVRARMLTAPAAWTRQRTRLNGM